MSALITYAVITLLFSFFCSISEAVLLSVRRPYILSLVEKEKPSGKLLRRMKDNMSRPLAAILTLNTFVNVIGSAGVGAKAAEVFQSIPVGFISSGLSLLILIFSEIIPKTLGATYWRTLAPIIAPPINILAFICFPFVLLSKLLTKRLSNTELTGLSREEFSVMADLGAKEGQLEAKESRILKNLFRFRSTRISNVMTPRTVVFAIQEDMDLKTFFELHHQTPFSRIPIYSKDREDITGFVLKDEILLAQARSKGGGGCLKDFKREIKAVSASETVSEVFEYLLNQREHILLVVDEYGMDGIVSLEDIVETLLGLEIVDEADKTVDMQELARALWEKRARKIGLLSDMDSAKQEPEGEAPEEISDAKQDL